ncbi:MULTISPECIES: hypothetical protein [unclassified Bacillus (in: firmicutes)]|uniref:hypothetical protein n=1 Tax=unclassified Bacillus (in: firmicutes) TaxID=185979 RepID=UPI0021BEDC2C|nr:MULTISPECIES: hypothetical protein [unclassified Bacillus (in: firmicutes)]
MADMDDIKIELLEGIPKELKSHDIAKSTVRKYAESLGKQGMFFGKMKITQGFLPI